MRTPHSSRGARRSVRHSAALYHGVDAWALTRRGAHALASAVALAARPAAASEWFVGGDGASDANPGSEAAPLATLGRAAELVGPGDVVTVRSGTYDVGTGLVLSTSGTEGSPIVFRGEPGARPVLTTSVPVTHDLVNVLGDHQELRGFEIRGSSKSCVSVWRASHVAVVDSVVHDCMGAGIWLGDDVLDDSTSHHLLVRDSVVYHSARANEGREAGARWPGALIAQRARDVRFVDNRVHENWGEGIICAVALRCEMRGNVVHDNYSVNLYFDNARESLAEGNFVYTLALEPHLRGGRPATGVSFANEDYGTVARTLDDIVFRSNVVVGGVSALYYGSYDLGGGLRNVRIVGNTFVGGTQEVVHLDADAHAGVVVRNNVFVAVRGEALVPADLASEGISADHNLWWGGSSGALAGAGDVSADPLLVDASGVRAGDFQLSAESPARGAGVADPDLPADFAGTARGPVVDLGAWQYLAEGTSGDGGGASGPPATSGGASAGPPSGGEGGSPVSPGGASASGGAASAGAPHGRPSAGESGGAAGEGGVPEPGASGAAPSDGCGCRGAARPPGGTMALFTSLLAVLAARRRRYAR